MPSGWRKLTVEDIGRELSPAYAEGIKRTARLESAITKTSRTIGHKETERDVQNYRYAERREQMGLVHRVLHDRNIYPDTTLKMAKTGVHRAERSVERLKIRRSALAGELNVTQRWTATAFEAIRPAAEKELTQRQRQAEAAREQLCVLETGERAAERQHEREGHRQFSGF